MYTAEIRNSVKCEIKPMRCVLKNPILQYTRKEKIVRLNVGMPIPSLVTASRDSVWSDMRPAHTTYTYNRSICTGL